MAVYNIQGLKGLTTRDRQEWENTQLQELGADFSTFSDDAKDRLYRNQLFTEAFKDDENFESYKKLSSEARDRLYANKLFTDKYKDDDNFKSLKQLSSIDRDAMLSHDNLKEQFYNQYGNSELARRAEFTDQAMKDYLDSGLAMPDQIDEENLSDLDISVLGTVKLGFEQIAKGTGKSLLKTAIWGLRHGGIDRNIFVLGTSLLGGAKEFAEEISTGDTTLKRTKDWISSAVSNTFENLTQSALVSLAKVLESPAGYSTTGNLDYTKLSEDDKEARELYKDRMSNIWGSYGKDIKRDFLQKTYTDAYKRAIRIDTERKQDQVLQSSYAQDIIGNYEHILNSTTYGKTFVTEVWENLVNSSPYGQTFLGTHYLKTNDSDKVIMLATYYAARDLYGEQTAYNILNNTLRNVVADNTNIIDKKINLGRNIAAQTVGVVGDAITGTVALFNPNDTDYHKGFNDAGEYMDSWNSLINPVYWGSVAQYGTFNPDEINRIKYAIGSPEYNKALQQYTIDFYQNNQDVNIQAADIEESFKNLWIKNQWKTGQFLGNQMSKYVTVRREEEEERLFGDSTTDAALGMAGQMMGQYAIASTFGGLGKLGKLGRATAKFGKANKAVRATGWALEKGTAVAAIGAPTLAIGEAYAQGAFEQTILKNRESLDNYLNTPEQQQAINNYLEANPKYLEIANGDMALARQLAEQDYRKQYYDELDRGAMTAYWTSFGIEAMRYAQFNMLYRNWIFGNAKKTLGLNPNNIEIGAKGAVNKLTSTAITKNFAKEAFNSGWTNYLDETTTAFALGIGTQQFNDYLGNYYDNNLEYNNMVGDLMAGLHSTSKSFTEDSSIKAFVIGSMGFFTGGNYANAVTQWISPTKRQLTTKEIQARAEKLISEGVDSREAFARASELSNAEAREELKAKLNWHNPNKSKLIFDWATYLTGLSSLQNISQQLEERDYNTKVCNAFNKQLTEDEKLLNSNESARALSNFVKLHQEGMDSDDEMVQKNANYQAVFNLLRTLHDMRQRGAEGTNVYTHFMQHLEALENGEISDNYIEAYTNSPANFDNENLFSEEERKSHTVETISKNIAKFREVEQSWEKNSKSLERVFGNIENADQAVKDIYYDALFKMSLQDDFESRLATMEEEISGINTVNTSSNSVVSYMIAKEGTKDKLITSLISSTKKQIEITDKEISKLQEDAKSLTGKELSQKQKEILKLQNRKNRLEDLVSKREQEQKEVANIATNEIQGTLTTDEVLRLNPEERLFAMTHAELFDSESRKAIEEAKSVLLNKLGKDYISKLRDTAIINSRMATNRMYTDYILEGNIQDAIENYYDMRQRKAQEAIVYAAQGVLNSLLPLVTKDNLTKKLIKSTVGMPIEGIKAAAVQIMFTNPNKAKVLFDLASVHEQIKFFDYAISLTDLNDSDKNTVSKLFLNAIIKAKTIEDIPELLRNLHESSTDKNKELIEKVLNKKLELTNLSGSVKPVEKTKEEIKTDKPNTPFVEEIKDKADAPELIDESTGEFRTLDAEEIDKTHPQLAPKAKVNTDTYTPKENFNNTQGTSMQGNWINAYNVVYLIKTGEQVEKVALKEGDIFDKWLKWSKLNNINYQNVIDFELAEILKSKPDLDVRMLTINPVINSITKDDTIDNAVILAIKVDDTIRRIHKEERSPYVLTNDGEYLIIGRAGVEAKASEEQKITYNNMSNSMKNTASDFFRGEPSVRFYVSPKYHTQVRYINGGSITLSLVGEQRGTHDIAEMLGDTQRDPFGIGKLENLGWYIQVGKEAREPINLDQKIVNNGDYFIPNNTERNSGAVFVMVPNGAGKYVPVKVTAALLTNIKEGRLKDSIQESIKKIISLDYNTRYEGILELLKTLVLNESNNILIGNKEYHSITLIDGSIKNTYDLATVSPETIIEAINNIPFRININQSTFQDDVRMKMYAEAGVFRTDAAVLGCTGTNFSVYACNSEGNPMKENAPTGNEDYVKHQDDIKSVKVNGSIARLRDGEWVIEDINGKDIVVESPSEIQKFNYALQIIKLGLTDVKTAGKFKYYIIDGSIDNPIVVKMDNNGNMVVPSKAKAIEFINLIAKEKAEAEAKRRLAEEYEEKAAKGSPLNLFGDNEFHEDKGAAVQTGIQSGLGTKPPSPAPKATAPVTHSKEKDTESETKLKLNLHNWGKSSTFADIYDKTEYFEPLGDALTDAFGEYPEPKTPQWEAFAKEHNLPDTLDESQVNDLIELINSCKKV